MEVRRLGWAGVELTAEGETLLIDPLVDPSPLKPFVGPPLEPLPAPEPGATGALLTHLHSDHADPQAIKGALAPGGRVARPATSQAGGLLAAGLAVAEQGLEAAGVEQTWVEPWQSLRLGPFEATALPAVDGLGDPQVSWLVEAGGVRVVHFGDTVMHGHWWEIADRAGPIDVALLPVNGAVVDLPHRRPASPLPVAMPPGHAAAAARVLAPALAVPIHYGTFHRPPTYAQAERPAQAFAEEAGRLGVETLIVAPGAGVR